MQIKINILASFLHFRPSCIFAWGPLYERLTNLITEDVLTVCVLTGTRSFPPKMCTKIYIVSVCVLSVLTVCQEKRWESCSRMCLTLFDQAVTTTVTAEQL